MYFVYDIESPLELLGHRKYSRLARGHNFKTPYNKIHGMFKYQEHIRILHIPLSFEDGLLSGLDRCRKMGFDLEISEKVLLSLKNNLEPFLKLKGHN